MAGRPAETYTLGKQHSAGKYGGLHVKHLTLQGEVWHTAARVLVVGTEPCVAMLHAGLFYSVHVTIRNTLKKKKFEVFLFILWRNSELLKPM